MNEYFAESLTILIQAIIALGLPILLAFVVKWIDSKAALANQQLTSEQRWMITWVCRAVVMAAEQSGLSGELKKLGTDKKTWAVGEASGWLKSIGLPVDVASISAQIEAIVLELNGHQGDVDGGWNRANIMRDFF